MQPPWMIEAWREYGQAELNGTAHNERIVALYRDAGHSQIKNDEVAWCAAFVGACLERSGLASTKSLMARSYLKWGKSVDRPRLGVIAVFSRGVDPAAGHVGFWIAETAGKVLLLGGNQSDSVNLSWIEKTRLLGVRRPEAPASAAAPAFFETALEHIFKVEGGYTNDKYDPGGPTNLGITLATLAAYKRITVTAENVADLEAKIKNLTRNDAADIYLTRYWQPSGADDLPRPVALMHFDAAVNQGVGTAARILQEAAGADVDGQIGPATRSAVWRSNPLELVATYAEIRRRRYRALPHFWRFGRGWLNRVDTTLAKAQALSHHDPSSAQPAIVEAEEGDMTMPETTNTQHSAPAEKWWGESLTIWGTVVTGLSTVLPVIAPLLGINLTSELVVLLGEQLVQVAQAVGGLAGTLMVIQGRMRATTRLTSRQLTLKV